MTPRERARLAVLKSELRRLEKQFEKAKTRRDRHAVELADLKQIMTALADEQDALEQGQLLLRDVG